MKKIIKLLLASGVCIFTCIAGVNVSDITTKKTSEETEKIATEEKLIKENVTQSVNKQHNDISPSLSEKEKSTPVVVTGVATNDNVENVLKNLLGNGSYADKVERQTVSKKRNTAVVPGQGKVSINMYPNKHCVVTDRRIVHVKKGINHIIFEDLLPGVQDESITFSTPKKGAISVRNYTYLDGNYFSKSNILRRSIGETVTFKTVVDRGQGEIVEGKVLHFAQNEKATLVAIQAGKRCYMVSPDDVISLGSDSFLHNQSRLDVVFHSNDTDDIEVVIAYSVSENKINLIPQSSIEIFDGLSRFDIDLKLVVLNNTASDISACILIKSDDIEKSMTKPSTISRIDHVTVPKWGKTVCVTQQQNLKYLQSYCAKIDNSNLVNNKASDLKVKNLITLEGAWKGPISSLGNTDSKINICYRNGEERDFGGQLNLADIICGDDLRFEIGETNKVIAKCQQTDRRSVSRDQYEYGMRVSLQNNTGNDTVISIAIDLDGRKYRIIKSSIEQDNGAWLVQLKPNELKEFYFKVRVNEQ